MNFLEILSHMGGVGWAVVGCLGLLSVYSLGVMIDKYRGFRVATRQSREFLPTLTRSLQAGDLDGAIASSERHTRSHLAQVVLAGAAEFTGAGGAGRQPTARVEAASRAIERRSAATLADLKRGLSGLATIGSIAPFIGLLGTVVGIIHAFQEIAASGSGGLAAVSGGIAEALIATAIGLFVAIPAVMGFNHFTSTLERFQFEMAHTSAELIDHLLKVTEDSRAAS